jgi:hypothetical protein
VVFFLRDDFLQRFPSRVSHGLATEDKAGTETTDDKDAMVYYHKIGTPQCSKLFTFGSDAAVLTNANI